VALGFKLQDVGAKGFTLTVNQSRFLDYDRVYSGQMLKKPILNRYYYFVVNKTRNE
jgi:hypothetical protein